MDRSFFLVCVFASTLTLTVSPGALAQGELATLVPASLVALLLTGTAYVCGEGGGAGQHAQMRRRANPPGVSSSTACSSIEGKHPHTQRVILHGFCMAGGSGL